MYHFSADNIAEPLVLSERITIPGILCQYLKPFQLRAVRFLHTHYKKHEGCIYNDESGLGKCAAASMFLGAIGQDKKILIVVQNDDSIVAGWQFHLSLLSDLDVTVITGNTDCTTSDHNVYIAKWCTLKDIEDLSNFKFDFVIVDNRGQMLNNSFCVALLLKNYEKKVDIFMSSLDVTLDLKLLHNVLRLCGRLEHQYMTWKAFEEKFSLPSVKDLAANKIELEEYFVKREILVDFCKDFRLRQYRHQLGDILPLVDVSRYKNNLETWSTEQNSKTEILQTKNTADMEAEFLELSDDKNTEELFEQYIKNKKERSLHDEIAKIIQRLPSHLEEEDPDMLECPMIMSPLVLLSDSDEEKEEEPVRAVENIEIINLDDDDEIVDISEDKNVEEGNATDDIQSEDLSVCFNDDVEDLNVEDFNVEDGNDNDVNINDTNVENVNVEDVNDVNVEDFNVEDVTVEDVNVDEVNVEDVVVQQDKNDTKEKNNESTARKSRKSDKPKKHVKKIVEVRENSKRRSALRSSVKQLRNRKLQLMKDIMAENRKIKHKTKPKQLVKKSESIENDKAVNVSVDDKFHEKGREERRSPNKTKNGEISKSTSKSKDVWEDQVSTIEKNPPLQNEPLKAPKTSKEDLESKRVGAVKNTTSFPAKDKKETLSKSPTRSSRAVANVLYNNNLIENRHTKNSKVSDNKIAEAARNRTLMKSMKNIESRQTRNSTVRDNKISEPTSNRISMTFIQNLESRQTRNSKISDNKIAEAISNQTPMKSVKNIESRQTRNSNVSGDNIAEAKSNQTPIKSIKNLEKRQTRNSNVSDDNIAEVKSSQTPIKSTKNLDSTQTKNSNVIADNIAEVTRNQTPMKSTKNLESRQTRNSNVSDDNIAEAKSNQTPLKSIKTLESRQTRNSKVSDNKIAEDTSNQTPMKSTKTLESRQTRNSKVNDNKIAEATSYQTPMKSIKNNQESTETTKLLNLKQEQVQITPNRKTALNKTNESTPIKLMDVKKECKTPNSAQKTPQTSDSKPNRSSYSKNTPSSGCKYQSPNKGYMRATRSMQRTMRSANHTKSKYMRSAISLDMEPKVKRKPKLVKKNCDNIENESLNESGSQKNANSAMLSTPTEKNINEDRFSSQASVLPMSDYEEIQCGQNLTPNSTTSSEQIMTVAQKTNNFLIPPTPTLARSIELPLTITVPDSELAIVPLSQHVTPDIVVLSSSQEEESASSSSQSTQSRRTRALKNKEPFKKPLSSNNKQNTTTDKKVPTFSEFMAEQNELNAAKSPDLFSNCSDVGINCSQTHNNKTTFEGFKIFGSEVKQFQQLYAAKSGTTQQGNSRDRSCLDLLEKMFDQNGKTASKNDKKTPASAAGKKTCVNNTKSIRVEHPAEAVTKVVKHNEKRPSPVDEDIIFEITNNCTFGSMIRMNGNGEVSPVQLQTQKPTQSNKITNYLIGSSPTLPDVDEDAQLPRTPTKRPANTTSSLNNTVPVVKRSPKCKHITQATKLTKWFSKQAAIKDHSNSPTKDDTGVNIKKMTRRSPLKRRRLDLSCVK